MKKAVFYRFIIFGFICLFLCFAIFSYIIFIIFYKQTEKNLTYSLNFIDYSLDYNADLQMQIDKLNPLILDDSTRITIIDKSGNVVADTSRYVSLDENHLNREEVKNSLENGFSISIRYSSTVNKDLIYAAVMSNKGDCIVRVSIPLYRYISYFKGFVPIILISIAALLAFILFIALIFSGEITKSLTEMSRLLLKIQNNRSNINLKEYKYEELNAISLAVKLLCFRIDENTAKIEYEKTKTEYILNNMTDGIILLDDKKDIIVINKAALNILGYSVLKCENNIIHYTQNTEFIDSISLALEGNYSIFDYTDSLGHIFSVYVGKIDEKICGKNENEIIILMTNVTIERKNEKIRKDFFSNISREFKEPINEIQNCAELLNSGINYDTGKKREFTNKILDSSKKINNLMNDILIISNIEANKEDENIIDIYVFDVVKDIMKELETSINDKCITVNYDVDDNIFIKTDLNKIKRLFECLITNSVKNNKYEGSMDINIKNENDSLNIIVSDTGIGLKENFQESALENYYQFNNYNDEKTNYTYLDLVAVKDIVNYYNGSIKIISKVNNGTKIEISIPNEELIKQ